MDPDKQVTEEVKTSTETTPTGTTEKQTVSTTTPPVSGATMAERVVYYLLGVLMVLLGFRFVLSLLGANQGNGFADFIYTLSGLFVQPFFTLFNYEMQYGQSRFEFETLIAMAVYAVVAGGIVALIRLPRKDTTTEA